MEKVSDFGLFSENSRVPGNDGFVFFPVKSCFLRVPSTSLRTCLRGEYSSTRKPEKLFLLLPYAYLLNAPLFSNSTK